MPATAVLAHGGADHLALGLVAAALVAIYGWAWVCAGGSDLRRLAAWVGGVGLVLAASLPFMERLAGRSFTGHMVQHLLVIVLAAPLLVVAEPLAALQRGRIVPPTAAGRRLGRWWRRWAAVVAPLVFVGVLYATHLSDIYDAALGDRLLHEAEHAAYLAGAVMIWAAVLGRRRANALGRLGVAFAVTAGGALLGMILISAPEPLIPTYVVRLGAAEALADQRRAAALMWVTGMLTTLPLLVIAVWRWARAEERAAHRTEALLEP